MPQLIFFRQTDELATPLTVDETSDSWWSSFMSVVPRATAAAALVLSASLAFAQQQQTEEIVSLTIAEEDWRPAHVIPAPTLAPVARADDDQFVPVVDDSDPWTPPWVIPPPVRAPILTDDDITITPLTAADESAGWIQFALPPPTSIPSPAWDDQALPITPTVGPPDEDYWQVYTPPLAQPRFIYLPDPEAIPGVLTGFTEDDLWWPPWVIAAENRSRLWLGDEEVVPQPAQLADDDPGLWRHLALPQALWIPAPHADPDAPLICPPDVDEWRPALVVPAPTIVTLWTQPDEVITPLRVDELYVWRGYSIPQVVVASAWIVDLENVVPPPFQPVDHARLVGGRGQSSEITGGTGMASTVSGGRGSVSEILGGKGMA